MHAKSDSGLGTSNTETRTDFMDCENSSAPLVAVVSADRGTRFQALIFFSRPVKNVIPFGNPDSANGISGSVGAKSL
jgi:hypothetical protein